MGLTKSREVPLINKVSQQGMICTFKGLAVNLTWAGTRTASLSASSIDTVFLR